MQRSTGPSGLADVLTVLLDKGLVIDAFVRVSLVGIELLTVDARIVVASVDTYLHFAEAVNRLDLRERSDAKDLSDLLGSGDRRGDSSRSKARGAVEGAPDALTGGSSDEAEDRQERSSEGSAGAEESDSPQDTQEDEEKGILERVRERGKAF
jgi:hypothetical protein